MISNISSRPGENKEFQSKVFVFSIFVATIFIILLIRIGYLQIARKITYTAKSEKIKEKKVRIPPLRGRIISSDNKILAENIVSFNIVISPKTLKEEQALFNVLNYLSKVLNEDFNDLLEKVKKSKDSAEVIVAENISAQIFFKIKENIDNLPGVSYEEVHYRYYPFHDTLAHVLGFTGPITKDELKLYSHNDYVFSDTIGKTGIEKIYENELRGKAGYRFYSVNAKMIIENEIKEKVILPEPGNDVILTVNMQFQKVVEDILADRVGAIVVVKPTTGEIIALASYPDFDPNIYILNTLENKIKRREIVLDTKETPLINRAIQSVYPAASVFKLVSTTAIVNEKLFSVHDRYYCSGIFKVGIESKKCWVYPAGHGSEDLLGGIKDSCDIYFYNVANRVGASKIKEYANMYNFGKILGIDLLEEKEGIIPDPEYFKALDKEWYDGDTMNMIIGQGEVRVTPLQMANFFSVICNKGYSFKPHLLKEIRSPRTDMILKKFEPEKIVDIRDNVSDETFDFIHTALRTVVTSGTAKGAFINNPYKIAGKTGTAEVGIGEKKDTHSWFVGFGPIDFPPEERIVVVVLIEHDKNNFLRYAASVANLVFYAYLEKVDFVTAANKMYYPVRKSYRLDGQ